MFGSKKCKEKEKYCEKSFSKVLDDIESRRENIKENTIIYFLLFFLKINKKNKREKEEKSYFSLYQYNIRFPIM